MRPGERWLLVGSAVGALLAVLGLRAPVAAVPDGAVALVGDVAISARAHDQALAALESDLPGSGADPASRRRVLDRLIDEAVLVDEGIAMGLPARDPRSRALLATAVLDLWAAEADLGTPGEAELAAFAVERGAALRGPERLAVAVDWRDAAGAPAVAPLPVPASPLPPDRLAGLLGQGVVAAVRGLDVGEETAPLASSGAFVVVRLLARTPGPEPSAEALLMAWRTAQQDASVRARLDARREILGVRLAPVDP
jgi:hypothetical protein